MENIQDKINTIMDNFDFAKVARVMQCLKWTWAMNDGNSVPIESEIRQKARKLLNMVYENQASSISGGGFTAYYDKEDYSLRLEFVIEEFDA